MNKLLAEGYFVNCDLLMIIGRHTIHTARLSLRSEHNVIYNAYSRTAAEPRFSTFCDKAELGQEEKFAQWSANVHYDIDPIIDRRVTRGFDFRIIPWLLGIWLLAFIGSSNIGNAKIDGIVDDLRLTENKFNIALVIFYVPYIMIDVPMLLTGCDLVSTFLRFAESYGGLQDVRVFLGLCEGGLLEVSWFILPCSTAAMLCSSRLCSSTAPIPCLTPFPLLIVVCRADVSSALESCGRRFARYRPGQAQTWWLQPLAVDFLR